MRAGLVAGDAAPFRAGRHIAGRSRRGAANYAYQPAQRLVHHFLAAKRIGSCRSGLRTPGTATVGTDAAERWPAFNGLCRSARAPRGRRRSGGHTACLPGDNRIAPARVARWRYACREARRGASGSTSCGPPRQSHLRRVAFARGLGDGAANVEMSPGTLLRAFARCPSPSISQAAAAAGGSAPARVWTLGGRGCKRHGLR